MHFLSRATLLAALIAPCASPLATAAGTATRGPVTVPADVVQSETQETGVISLNPARDSVSTVHGYDSTTSISVDADNGIIKGYAEFDLPSDATLPLSATVGSSVQGSLTSPITFAGGATWPRTVTAELSFDGSFVATNSFPTFALTGNITASTFTGSPFTQSIYQSQLVFAMSKLTPTYAPQVITTSVESRTENGVTTTTPAYSGASQTALDASAASLDAIVRLSFDVQPGVPYVLSSHVNGIVTAEPGSQQSATDGELLASAGILDFSNTAQLRLFVPQDVTVTGDALLDNIVIASAVPEPQIATMMLAGLLGIGVLARRRARK